MNSNLINTGTGWSLVYFFGAAVTPVVAVFSSKAMVPILVIFGLILGIRTWPNPVRMGPLAKLTAVGICLLLIWSLATILWTPDPMSTIERLGSLVLCLCVGFVPLCCISSWQDGKLSTLADALAIGFCFALVILLFEILTLSWITRHIKGVYWPDVFSDAGGINLGGYLKDNLTILSLLVWPASFRLWMLSNKFAAVLLVLGLGMASVYLEAAAVTLALVGGCIFILFGMLNQKIAGRSLSILFVVVVLSAPFVVKPLTWLGNSANGESASNVLQNIGSLGSRLIIWNFVVQKIEKKPYLGWGMNASRNLPEANIKQSFFKGKQLVHREFNIPLHPHNQALQIWFELGFIGACIVSLFGGVVIWRFSAQVYRPHLLPVMYAFIVSILIFDLLSFGIWQNWWLATQFFSLTLLLLMGETKEPKSE